MISHFTSWSRIKKLLSNHFLTGIFVLIPFAVVAWIFVKVVRMISSFHELLPEAWNPANYFPSFYANLIHLLMSLALGALFILFVSILGWSSRQYFGQKFFRFLGRGIQKIPFVNSIYSSLDQLFKTMSAGGKQQFSRVVYIEYPRAGCYTLAFVTGVNKGFQNSTEPHLNLFVPTTPNPTSGFYLVVPESQVKDAHMKVEEAFKSIISLGIASGETTGT
jgi:uncharacterized membrane protein